MRTCTEPSTNVACLDMIQYRSSSSSEATGCGILLEVSPSGGLLHVDEPLTAGTRLELNVEGRLFTAKVRQCDRDEFGCYAQFSLDAPWFPVAYEPAYTLPAGHLAEAA